MESKGKSNPAAIAIFYGIAAVTIAAYGYGIGGMDALRAGAIYAVVGLVLAFACVGFAPRFIVVVALVVPASLVAPAPPVASQSIIERTAAPSVLEAGCTVDFASPARASSTGPAKRSSFAWELLTSKQFHCAITPCASLLATSTPPSGCTSRYWLPSVAH